MGAPPAPPAYLLSTSYPKNEKYEKEKFETYAKNTNNTPKEKHKSTHFDYLYLHPSSSPFSVWISY